MAEEKVTNVNILVKTPPFWPDKPDLWFTQLEAQFHIANISKEETKFYYLLSYLDAQHIENVADIIRSTSCTTKYSEAKKTILEVSKESESKQLHKLLHGLDLGQLKPSQLLQKMLSLAGDNVGDKLVRQLWLEKLPESVRNVVVVSNEELKKVAAMADKILDLSPVPETYSADSKTLQMPTLLKKIEVLEEQISALTTQDNFRRDGRSNFRSRNRSRSRSSSRSRGRFNEDGRLCYYHFTFGRNARKCTAPCQWKEAGNDKQQ